MSRSAVGTIGRSGNLRVRPTCRRCGRPIRKRDILTLGGFVTRWHPEDTGGAIACPACPGRFCSPMAGAPMPSDRTQTDERDEKERQ